MFQSGKKDYKVDKQGFKEAWNQGVTAIHIMRNVESGLANAFDEYIKALVYNNVNAELNYKTGVSALFSDKKDEASAYLLNALSLKA